MAVAVIGLAVLFFLGHALKWFFIKTKVPDLLILVAIGYVLGPVTGVLHSNDLGQFGPFLSTMALIVILYEGGLSLRTKDLLTSSLPALAISILGAGLIIFLATMTVKIFGGQPWPVALLVGLGVGSTSSAVVIPMVKHLSITEKTKTILSLESAFTDILAIVLFLVILDSSLSGQFDFNDILIGVGPKTFQAVVFGVLGGLLWSFLRRCFSFLTDLRFSGEAFAFLVYGIVDLLGFNGAMAVLALGFTLANLDLFPRVFDSILSRKAVNHREMKLLGEIVFILKTTFFIYLGMLIQFGSVHKVVIAVIISLLIFLTRYISVRAIFRPSKFSRLDAMAITAMGPRGLACAVLATLPLQRGMIEEQGLWIQDTIFAIIPFSIVLTALFIIVSETPSLSKLLAKLFMRYPEDRDDDSELSMSDEASMEEPTRP